MAKIQAFEQLRNHIFNLMYRRSDTAHAEQEAKGAIWSAKQNDIVEVAADLYYSGSVNYGKGGVYTFCHAIRILFYNVRLNNVPRIIYGMTIRKKDDAPFLHSVTERFLKMIAERNR